MFRASFKEFFKGGLKHINSLSKKVCFVVVVCHSSQLPEQKEGLFFLRFFVSMVISCEQSSGKKDSLPPFVDNGSKS